ncbi:MAG: hypothetical protein QOF25_1462 [Mycobacterium sp.]|nr:hypothetical protein [Mycobacterium sp.]
MLSARLTYAKAVRNCVGRMDDPTPRHDRPAPGLAVVADGSVVLFSGNGATGPPWVYIVQPATAPLAPMPTAWRRAAAGIVCKRLDTALGKDAAAEAQPIRAHSRLLWL